MSCFFYKSYDELLEFAKSEGIEKSSPKSGADGVIDLSEKSIKDFLSSKGHTSQDLDELVKPNNLVEEEEAKQFVKEQLIKRKGS